MTEYAQPTQYIPQKSEFTDYYECTGRQNDVQNKIYRYQSIGFPIAVAVASGLLVHWMKFPIYVKMAVPTVAFAGTFVMSVMGFVPIDPEKASRKLVTCTPPPPNTSLLPGGIPGGIPDRMVPPT